MQRIYVNNILRKSTIVHSEIIFLKEESYLPTWIKVLIIAQMVYVANEILDFEQTHPPLHLHLHMNNF